MDNLLLSYTTVILALVLNLNLWLTFRLFQALKTIRLRQESPEPRKVGEPAPVFSASRLSDGAMVSPEQFPQYAKVLVFLSTECTKCKGKLPELAQTINHVGDAGVLIWIVSNEPPRRVEDFLSNHLLSQSALLVEDGVYAQLNPLRASPYYQFVDDNNLLQAHGMIGDENWRRFCAQLKPSSDQHPVTNIS